MEIPIHTLLYRAAHRQRNALRPHLRELGLGPGQPRLLANLAGVYLGMSLPLDVVIGTLATFLAAVASFGLRRFTIGGLPVLSGLMPVLFNAVLVGWELWYFFTEAHTLGTFLLNALWVGIGELAAVMVLGMILYQVLKKSGLGRVLFSGARQA